MSSKISCPVCRAKVTLLPGGRLRRHPDKRAELWPGAAKVCAGTGLAISPTQQEATQ